MNEEAIKEALVKSGGKIDRWVLRLGKSEEEAGKFEPWHMGPDDFEEDLAGFLACLRLTRLVDSVNERMKNQKKTIRGRKKEQKEAAKLIAKEQEKLRKALEKAEVKRLREIEKTKIKEEAKKKREADKATKKRSKGEEANKDLSVREGLRDEQTQSTQVSAEVDLGVVLSPLEEPLCTSTETEATKRPSAFYEEEPELKPTALPEEK